MFFAALTLGGLFSDHMVLQRERQNPIWGSDTPEQVVTLTVEGAPTPVQTVQVTVGADGTWRLEVPELPVGGPYRLRIQGSEEKVIHDVLVGDVWVASGQSNMEWPLSRARDADREIAAARYPAIRVTKIPLQTARTPQTDVVTEWRPASPETAASFTAVGYFFAREIHQTQNVPVGIIDTTWGGTRIEPWISREALRAVWPGVEEQLARIAAADPDLPRIRAEHQKRLLAWERTVFPQDTGNEGLARGWARPDFDDGAWQTITLPNTFQSTGFANNGAFWARRVLELPASAAGRELVLELGAVDDFEITYFNGEQVGAMGEETFQSYQTPRRYTVPGHLVRAGKNVIAVRVFDRFGEGGFMGPAVKMFAESNGERFPLEGAWRWAVERTIPRVTGNIYATHPGNPPELDFSGQPAALYNAMVAPLIPYGIRGFLWYQGESNIGNYADYHARFTALIRDWRTRWGQGNLPFYFVQLSAFTQSWQWPYLREAQTQTLAEPQTGMAVSLDIGNATDIHPNNKQDVGRRLALLARRDIYGEKDLVAEGPTLTRVAIHGNEVRVFFRSAAGLRTRDGKPEVLGFALAGADGRYHPANARIDGETVIVTSPAVPRPQSVRYGWADYLEVNLENSDGLPAAPFRTDGF